MRGAKLADLLYIFLSTIMFSLVLSIILAVFNVPSELGLLFTMLLLIVISVSFKSYFVKLPLYFVTVGISFFYFEPGKLLAVSNRVIVESQEIISKKITTYPESLPHLLILLSLIILIELQFVTKRVLLIGSVLISYLLLLNVFNEVNVTLQVLVVTGLTILLNSLKNTNVKPMQSFIISSFILCLLFVITWFIPSSGVENRLLQKTVMIRNKLSDQGFYYAINQRKYGMTSITGFSEDDSELGGAIEEDHRVQFRAIQKNPHYWRIDSKNKYTGKGWEATGDVLLEKGFSEDVISVENGEKVGGEVEEIRLLFSTSDTYVPTTYGKLEMKSLLNKKKSFTKNLLTNRVDLKESQLKSQLDVTLYPLMEENQGLEEVPLTNAPGEIDYLQLPTNYSDKVTNLALNLTEEKTTLIDKVESIEQYLKTSPELRYSKSETTYPRENQDYVEHFLFESQVGYCDNFSTSMVVMLRSVGIPARWVKGFNTGLMTGSEGDRDVYSIRNQDAHSWVEVYFEGHGWLPFEPTPTFFYPTSEASSSKKEEIKKQGDMKEKEINLKKTEETTATTSEDNRAVQKKKEMTDQFDRSHVLRYLVYVLSLLLLVFGLLGWHYRLYLWSLFVLNYRRKEWPKLYLKVLNKIETKIYREPNMPLLQYSELVEMQYSDYKPYFSELTKRYERNLYSQSSEFNEEDEIKLKKLIQIVIKNQ